jgi:hypothetical protein
MHQMQLFTLVTAQRFASNRTTIMSPKNACCSHEKENACNKEAFKLSLFFK